MSSSERMFVLKIADAEEELYFDWYGRVHVIAGAAAEICNGECGKAFECAMNAAKRLERAVECQVSVLDYPSMKEIPRREPAY